MAGATQKPSRRDGLDEIDAEISRSWWVMRRAQSNVWFRPRTSCRGRDNLSGVESLADTSCRDRHLLEPHSFATPGVKPPHSLWADNCLPCKRALSLARNPMGLRLRLVVLLMLPLLLVSGVYSVVRVQQEAFARVQDEQERAARMARTIQIAVENALALRVRQSTDLVGLLESLTLGQREIDRIRIFDWDGQVLAASSVRTVALAPQSDAIAQVMKTGTPDLVETHVGDRSWVVYILPVRYLAPSGRSRSTSRQAALEWLVSPRR